MTTPPSPDSPHCIPGIAEVSIGYVSTPQCVYLEECVCSRNVYMAQNPTDHDGTNELSSLVWNQQLLQPPKVHVKPDPIWKAADTSGWIPAQL